MPVLQAPPAVAIENILLATDFSDNSRNAAKYAAGIARRFGSKLEIAHIYNPESATSYEESVVIMTAAERKQIADENLESFATHLALEGIPTDLLSVEGHKPSAELLDIAGERRADLIVVGTESKSGIARLILGSTAEQILRGANCPVLTVGPKARTPQPGPLVFRTIVYATDFSPEAAKAAVVALSFAEDSGAHLYCCCVLSLNDEGLKTRAELHRSFSKKLKESIPEEAYDWCAPHCVVEYGEAADAILTVAQRVNADLIVLGARKASFWLTRVEGGLTPALLAEAKCPVMTIC
jgi:nucleotide-binding universal stress UspA family protein